MLKLVEVAPIPRLHQCAPVQHVRVEASLEGRAPVVGGLDARKVDRRQQLVAGVRLLQPPEGLVGRADLAPGLVEDRAPIDNLDQAGALAQQLDAHGAHLHLVRVWPPLERVLHPVHRGDDVPALDLIAHVLLHTGLQPRPHLRISIRQRDVAHLVLDHAGDLHRAAGERLAVAHRVEDRPRHQRSREVTGEELEVLHRAVVHPRPALGQSHPRLQLVRQKADCVLKQPLARRRSGFEVVLLGLLAARLVSLLAKARHLRLEVRLATHQRLLRSRASSAAFATTRQLHASSNGSTTTAPIARHLIQDQIISAV